LPPSGNSANDAYYVVATGTLYVWDGSQWFDAGNVQGVTGPTGADGSTGPTGPTGPGGGAIDVDTTVDATTFVGLYEDPTGTIGGKTNSGITYDASAETLAVTSIETESINAPDSSTGPYVLSSPTTITLDPAEEIINDAPMKLVSKTNSDLSTLVASAGSVVFNTSEQAAYFYNGSSWLPIDTSGSGISFNASAAFDVSSYLSSAYRFDSHYSGDNPDVYVAGGTTVGFDLSNVSASHPFLLQEDTGSGFQNITTGIVHVGADGTTITTGAGAQAQTSGILYWFVPANSSSSWRYICQVHTIMVGNLVIKPARGNSAYINLASAGSSTFSQVSDGGELVDANGDPVPLSIKVTGGYSRVLIGLEGIFQSSTEVTEEPYLLLQRSTDGGSSWSDVQNVQVGSVEESADTTLQQNYAPISLRVVDTHGASAGQTVNYRFINNTATVLSTSPNAVRQYFVNVANTLSAEEVE